MKQKRHNGHFLKWATAIVLTFAFFAGCRKYDSILPDTGQNYEELKSKFFNTNSTADIEIKKLAADIKKQDSIFRFLPDFVRKNGLPKWDKVIYKTSSNAEFKL
jgi:antibiotic biosynthesis monooxygenase (ABM) superfamily enzyme